MEDQCVITRRVTVAAGVFAPGHLGELTQIVPFEMVDQALAATGTAQVRIRVPPARVVVYLLLAGCLFAELGYRQAGLKLTSPQEPGAYGKQAGNHGGSGYPLLRLVALVACGTRTVIDAVFGPASCGELDYAHRLRRSLHARHARAARPELRRCRADRPARRHRRAPAGPPQEQPQAAGAAPLPRGRSPSWPARPPRSAIWTAPGTSWR